VGSLAVANLKIDLYGKARVRASKPRLGASRERQRASVMLESKR
jgi:hypothetical protein